MAVRALPSGVQVPIHADTDIIAVRQEARQLAEQLGFSPSDRTLLATAVSELARNIVQYARGGVVVLKAIHNASSVGVSILAEDRGPGIADLALALRDGYSTSGSLGLGLPGVKRLMSEFEISSRPGEGTRVFATMSIPKARVGSKSRRAAERKR
jgi:serine/threonine-protein kinase RsbT